MEHYYHSQKSANPEYKAAIRAAMHHAPVDHTKFTQNGDLALMVLATGGAAD